VVKADSQNELIFLPLGGVGEIGMNLALYGYGPAHKREWLIVDCGVTFPGPDLPGIDLVMADIKFIEANRAFIKGMVITHAHEDHYGAVADLWPKIQCPLYVTPFTAAMLEAKFKSDKVGKELPVTLYNAGDIFECGHFKIEAIAVTHSIPEPMALAITTPLGTVIHTGDWKIDAAPTIGDLIDEARFRELGDAGVLALMCDSTNAMRDGDSPAEQEVSDNLTKIIEEAVGRVAITSFSSNVGRIRSIAQAARDAGRSVMLLGRSMKRVVEISTELGFMDGLPEFISQEDFQSIARKNLVIILTGSQGESRAALAKIANNEMREVALTAGDTVIFSSRTIPGNEKSINDIKNKLIDMGIDIISDDQALVHVSGHPRRNELKKMYSWVRPRILVPVHGEAAHLNAQAALGLSEGILEVPQVRNGQMLRLAPGKAEIIDETPCGRIYKDGKIIGDYEEIGIGDRKKLAFAGHVSLCIHLNKKFEITGEPELESIGLPSMDVNGDEIDDKLFDAALDAIDSMSFSRRKDLDGLRETVRRAVRSTAEEIWGKKPVVTVFLNVI
jgi:ribonuclease J